MANVILPKVLTDGTTAYAGDVMSNFTALQAAINGGIEQTNLADNAVSAGKIQAGAVTWDKLAAGAVTDEKVASNANIAFAKLVPLATSRALVTNSVGQVIASAITATQLGHLSGVTSNIQTQINAAAVSVGDGAVTSSKLASDAVTFGKIADGAVTEDALHPRMVVYAGRVASNGTSVTLPGGWGCSRQGAGHYRVTHPLNTTQVVVNITVDSDLSPTRVVAYYPSTTGYFTVRIANSSTGTATDTAFAFMAMAPEAT